MRIHPYTQADFLKEGELSDFENSDRLLLPRLLYEGFECGPGKTVLLSISNSIGQSIAGTVHDVHDKEAIIYVPSWMYYSLELTDDVLCSVIEHCKCSKISMRPHHEKFMKVTDWTEKLVKAFERYTSITEGSTVPLIIDGVLQKFTIEALYPYNHKTCLLKNENGVDINLLKSLELQKQEETLKYLYKKEVSKVVAFSCIGFKLGGQAIPQNSTQKGLILNAVLGRLIAKKTISMAQNDPLYADIMINHYN